MIAKKKLIGKVITPGDVNVWPHEDRTAKALAKAGYVVEFIRKSNRERETSADVYINGEKWEMKAPNGSSLKLVEKNLRRALKQAGNIIFDSRRVKQIPDAAIQRELTKWSFAIKGVSKVKFVNRYGEVIDIK